MKSISGIILAGGYSSRMGKNKADLLLDGKTFLEREIELLRNAGIDDIAVAGYSCNDKNVKSVNDVIPHKGPMSGIHAGLKAIENEAAFVIAVDTPLVPEKTIRKLSEIYNDSEADAVILSHNSKIEPLIGIYSKPLISVCEELLNGDRTSLREIFRNSKTEYYEYTGDELLLMNCNTPEEYRIICDIYRNEALKGAKRMPPFSLFQKKKTEITEKTDL